MRVFKEKEALEVVCGAEYYNYYICDARVIETYHN